MGPVVVVVAGVNDGDGSSSGGVKVGDAVVVGPCVAQVVLCKLSGMLRQSLHT
jgi:hypothetical protein